MRTHCGLISQRTAVEAIFLDVVVGGIGDDDVGDSDEFKFSVCWPSASDLDDVLLPAPRL